MRAPAFDADELTKVLPVINVRGSDSAMLDNTLEFLVMSGMELPLAASILIPEPWSHNDTISREVRDFYQYYATMMEPWGRSRFHPVFRRRPDGRDPGSKRAASFALLYHGRRPSDPVLGGGRTGNRAGAHPQKRAAPSGENAFGGHEPGQSDGGLGDKGILRQKRAL